MTAVLSSIATANFSELGDGLQTLAQAAAASDPAVARLLAEYVAAVQVAEQLTDDTVAAMGVMLRWLLGELCCLLLSSLSTALHLANLQRVCDRSCNV